MPYINVSTSAKVNDKDKLLEEISILISSLTNKSRSFVMAKIDDNCQMYFDDETPSCFLEIKSIKWQSQYQILFMRKWGSQ